MGIGQRDRDAAGPAGAGDTHELGMGELGEIWGSEGEWMGRWGALTFSAFLAASASERLSKLTKPTGCGGRREGEMSG